MIRLDPNEVSEISNANNRQNVRKFVKDQLKIKKPVAVHSRTGVGLNVIAWQRLGTASPQRGRATNAHIPTKITWMRRMRVLHLTHKQSRDAMKITKHLYRLEVIRGGWKKNEVCCASRFGVAIWCGMMITSI